MSHAPTLTAWPLGLSRYAQSQQAELFELRRLAIAMPEWDVGYAWERRARSLLDEVRGSIREDAPTVTTRRKRVERDEREGSDDVIFRINPEVARRSWALHREHYARSLSEISALRAIRDELAAGIKALESWRAWDRRRMARLSELLDRALA